MLTMLSLKIVNAMSFVSHIAKIEQMLCVICIKMFSFMKFDNRNYLILIDARFEIKIECS